ncbi:aspartic peptidase domain-containing protein [Zopfochytrium polystomum]|nr:aspartic peptidase domain-containing protein [Zopfochytrium polystomum]
MRLVDILFVSVSVSVLSGIAAVSDPKQRPSIPIEFGVGRTDDKYYIARVSFDNQSFPLLVDFASADTFIAGADCRYTTSNASCTASPADAFSTTAATRLWDPSTNDFGTIVGEGGVLGRMANLSTVLGDSLSLPAFPTPIIYSAALNEFQDYSFAGLLGLAMQNVSRVHWLYGALPLFEALVESAAVGAPVFSATFPRLNDPDSAPAGRLTLGWYDEEEPVAFTNVTPIINLNYDSFPETYQNWNVPLTGIRVNGVEVPLINGSIAPPTVLGLVDSGDQFVGFRSTQIDAMAPLMPGFRDLGAYTQVEWPCDQPQLIEVAVGDQWLAIDPLDLLVPGKHRVVNGTVYCQGGMNAWDRWFGDAILGVPFLRSVLSVFDYGSTDLASPAPRVGFAPRVDRNRAIADYAGKYKKRVGLE